MPKEIKNIGASVRARLLQLPKASGQSFDLVLTRFALERLLFRLSQSTHADRFVLKGAMLMMSWFDDPHRGTRETGCHVQSPPRSRGVERPSLKTWRMRLRWPLPRIRRSSNSGGLLSGMSPTTRVIWGPPFET